ncbi:hypothetical protein QAD02_003213 [Eretmocerus hayati]|uniref:Uncharacterized protein n=1 Tax=Eretmocerus hayati TaxID=131215 RepID=A0ACC2NLJ7_9HYME|nr:hypothetical protein QAD02_003213 [Eretmocerus hayati]
MSHCFACNESFDGKQLIVACIVCTELYHATNKCADLTASEIKVIELKKKPKLQFKCANCEKSGKLSFGDHLANVKNSLEEQFDNLKCNLESLNKSFSKDISVIKNDLKNIKESCATIDSLGEKVDTAQEDIVNLKASVNCIPKIQDEIDSIKATLADPNSSQLVAGTLNSANIEERLPEALRRLEALKNNEAAVSLSDGTISAYEKGVEDNIVRNDLQNQAASLIEAHQSSVPGLWYHRSFFGDATTSAGISIE